MKVILKKIYFMEKANIHMQMVMNMKGISKME